MKFDTFLLILISLVLTSSLHAADVASTIPSEIFKGCAKCHGQDAKNPAFGRSEALAGQEVEDLIESINFFKESEFGTRGVINVMAKQVTHLSDKQIEDLAKYISKIGTDK